MLLSFVGGLALRFGAVDAPKVPAMTPEKLWADYFKAMAEAPDLIERLRVDIRRSMGYENQTVFFKDVADSNT